MTAHRAGVALFALLTATSLVYATRLSFAPPYLMQDEVNFALQAQSVSASGRDTNGRLLPVYFSEVGFEAGRDPVMIYLTALWLKVRPLSESAVRMPTALVGVLSVGLMFVAGRTLFQSATGGLAAAAMLALTPAYFINSRLALSIAYPIPFILGWLCCLFISLETGDRRTLFAAGLSLGAGVYAYAAGLILMPVYAAITVVALVRQRRRAWILAVVAGFVVAMAPLVWWQLVYPDRYHNMLVVYRVPEPFSLEAIRGRITAMWMFFNPDLLFVSGDSRMTNSTRSAGLFPLAFAALIPVGIYQIWRGALSVAGTVILLGFLTAPLAAAVSGRLDINRVLAVIPFGVLVALAGLRALWAARTPSVRFLGTGLLVSIVVQFGFVYSDYMGVYRVSAAPWFGGDSRGAIEMILEGPSTPVYLDRRTSIERYWRFYALMHGRADRTDQPTYYDAGQFDPATVSVGSRLICEHGGPVCNTLAGAADWRRVTARIEPDGKTSFEVFERAQAPK